MSGQIGLRLFQQLKTSDPGVSRDDYFDEEHNTWDIDAIEQDLKVNRERLSRTGTISISHASLNSVAPNHRENIITHGINPLRMNNVLTTNTNELNTNGLSTPINLNDSLHPSTHSASKRMEDVDEDIDLNRTVSSQQTTDTNPSQMPSPNASPSIEYDGSQTESDTDPHLNRNASATNGIQAGKKRKAETEINPVSKKRKIEAHHPAHHVANKWNEVVLKKLHSLKRQVKNSSWFWEPVDEVRHSAPHYYLVCPMPSDYGTICKKLQHYKYDDLDELLRDCELVFINARLYNTAVHAVHEASMRLEKKFKELMNAFVCQHCKEYGSDKTLTYWQNAKKNFKPFAVPKMN